MGAAPYLRTAAADTRRVHRAEARALAARAGSSIVITTQTGEQPADPFFTLGDVIVTTYDQVLSVCSARPYGLSRPPSEC